jgi:hypothetical protein
VAHCPSHTHRHLINKLINGAYCLPCFVLLVLLGATAKICLKEQAQVAGIKQSKHAGKAVQPGCFVVPTTRACHRCPRNVYCSSFVMCLLLALALPRVFLLWPLRVLTRQTRQAVNAISSLFFNMMSMGLSLRSGLFAN